MVPPSARAKLHAALDLLLDAWAECQGEPTVEGPRGAGKRMRPVKVREMPPGVDEFTLRRAAQSLDRVR